MKTQTKINTTAAYSLLRCYSPQKWKPVTSQNALLPQYDQTADSASWGIELPAIANSDHLLFYIDRILCGFCVSAVFSHIYIYIYGCFCSSLLEIALRVVDIHCSPVHLQ